MILTCRVRKAVLIEGKLMGIKCGRFTPFIHDLHKVIVSHDQRFFISETTADRLTFCSTRLENLLTR